jgi:hypothetical protein
MRFIGSLPMLLLLISSFGASLVGAVKHQQISGACSWLCFCCCCCCCFLGSRLLELGFGVGVQIVVVDLELELGLCPPELFELRHRVAKFKILKNKDSK